MDLAQAAKEILSVLKERQEKIVARRFGLLGYKKATLARIGGDLDRTRERIRQIEAAGLKKLSKQKNLKRIDKEVEKVKKEADKLGGIIVLKRISDKLLKSDRSGENVDALAFLLTIIPQFKVSKKNQTFKRFWYNKDYSRSTIKNIANKYEDILEKLEEPVSIKKLIKEFKETGLGKKVKFPDKALEEIFHTKKTLGKGKQGRVGLMSWPKINPKSARDKAYLILKEEGQPLHYRKIAKKIKEQDFYSNHAPTAPTVHNEVILDDRFVLIGRGVYALEEWGYEPGTVKDVIESILKKHSKGLKKEEIIDKVLKQRQVAKNTVTANLNREKIFQKKNGVYHLQKS